MHRNLLFIFQNLYNADNSSENFMSAESRDRNFRVYKVVLTCGPEISTRLWTIFKEPMKGKQIRESSSCQEASIQSTDLCFCCKMFGDLQIQKVKKTCSRPFYCVTCLLGWSRKEMLVTAIEIWTHPKRHRQSPLIHLICSTELLLVLNNHCHRYWSLSICMNLR